MDSIKKLPGAARGYPQSAYSALQRSVQREWQYLQRTTPNVESCFDLLETAMQEEFLPALFGEARDDGDYWLELAQPTSSEIVKTSSTKHSQFRNAESSSQDRCLQLSLKDETTFETAKHASAAKNINPNIQR